MSELNCKCGKAHAGVIPPLDIEMEPEIFDPETGRYRPSLPRLTGITTPVAHPNVPEWMMEARGAREAFLRSMSTDPEALVSGTAESDWWDLLMEARDAISEAMRAYASETPEWRAYRMAALTMATEKIQQAVAVLP